MTVAVVGMGSRLVAYCQATWHEVPVRMRNPFAGASHNLLQTSSLSAREVKKRGLSSARWAPWGLIGIRLSEQYGGQGVECK